MFDLHFSSDGTKVLRWVERSRHPNERGMWVDICRDTDKGRDLLLRINREVGGLQVELDDRGTWRALVLKD